MLSASLSPHLAASANPFTYTPLTFSPEMVRQMHEDTVQTVMEHHEDFHAPQDFTRDSGKLNLDNLTQFTYSLASSNLGIHITRFCYENQIPEFSNSSLSEARSNLSYKYFEEMFELDRDKLIQNGFFSQHRFKYPRLAIDGVTFHLEPFNKEECDRVKTKAKDRPRYGCHAVTTYDVDNRMYQDVCIQRMGDKNERAGALELASRCSTQSILIMDRGFHSFKLEYELNKMDHYYLIRLKEKDFYSLFGIPKEYDIDSEIDITVNRVLTTKYPKRYRGDALHHRYCGKDKSFLDENGECKMTFRLVKIEVPAPVDDEDQGKYQYFITNIPYEELSIDDIKLIYGSRWLVETSYLELKYYVGKLAIHARKMNSIYQEIYAALDLYNLSNAVIQYCELHRPEPKRNLKYKYRLNRKYAFEICRDFFNYKILDEDYLIQRILKHKTPIKPTRYFKRRTIRKADSNQHRLSGQ